MSHLRKQIILFVLMISLFSSYAIAQEEEGLHDKWLVRQREYPSDSVNPADYFNAATQQASNYSAVGYYSPDPWVTIGPKISGSGTGRVTCVKYDPNYNPSTRPYIYVTGHNGGVWRSDDGGNNFISVPTDQSLPTQSSGVICLDPNNPDVIYYATGGSVEGFKFNYYGFGVYKSTDRGNTWNGGNNVNNGKVTHSYNMVVNPSNSNIIYLAEFGGFFISSNAGSTFTAGPYPGSCQGVSTSSDGQIVCAIGGYNDMFWPPHHGGMGYIRSTDYGGTFQLMSNYGFAPGERTQISVSHANKNYVYVVTRSSTILAFL